MTAWPDQQGCTVEVLIVPGCPGTDIALRRIQEAAEALGVETNLRVMTVDREEDARTLGFYGSPTVRVEGRDVEDVAGLSVGLTCRLYDGGQGEGRERAPATSAIRRAIAAAVAGTPAARGSARPDR
jgi:hypothetical protein